MCLVNDEIKYAYVPTFLLLLKEFLSVSKYRIGSLGYCLGYLLKWLGCFFNGLVDAVNSGCLVAKLVTGNTEKVVLE